jgi:hypothetical protein
MAETEIKDAPSKMFCDITAQVMAWHLCGYGKYYVLGFNTM